MGLPQHRMILDAGGLLAAVADNNIDHFWALTETSGAAAADTGAVGGAGGTYTGSPTLAAAQLISTPSDAVVELNGASQYVDSCGDTTTLQAWHNSWEFFAFGFSRFDVLGVDALICTSTGGNAKGVVVFTSSDGSLRVELRDGSAKQGLTSGAAFYAAGEKHMWAVHGNGTTMKFYKDGAAVTAAQNLTVGTAVGASSQACQLGAQNGGVTWDGLLGFVGADTRSMSHETADALVSALWDASGGTS